MREDTPPMPLPPMPTELYVYVIEDSRGNERVCDYALDASAGRVPLIAATLNDAQALEGVAHRCADLAPGSTVQLYRYTARERINGYSRGVVERG